MKGSDAGIGLKPDKDGSVGGDRQRLGIRLERGDLNPLVVEKAPLPDRPRIRDAPGAIAAKVCPKQPALIADGK